MKLVGKTFDGKTVEVELKERQHLRISGGFATGKSFLLRSIADNLGEKGLFLDDIDNPKQLKKYIDKANEKGTHLVFTELTDGKLNWSVENT